MRTLVSKIASPVCTLASGAVQVLPKIVHTRPLIGKPIAERYREPGERVGRNPQSRISIDLSHGDKHTIQNF